MGGYLSKQKIDPNDFEKVLSKLDEKIQKVEVKLSDIKFRQRRTGVLVVTYCTLAWLVYVTYCFLLLQQHNNASTETMTSQVTLILVIPVGIYYLRNAITWFYIRKHTTEETRLGSLRAQQKLKVAELKKKTSYYTTQSLLERYDAEALAKRKQQLQQQQQQQQHMVQTQQQRKPVSMPGPRAMPGVVGQQQQRDHGGPSATLGPVHPPQHQTLPPNKGPPQWYDKIIDALIGEEGLETKYALICLHCFTHNGLVLPGEVDTIQYICPHCKKFNPSRKSRQLHPNGPVLPPRATTPSPMGSPILQHATLINEHRHNHLTNDGQQTDIGTKNDEPAKDGTEQSIAARIRQRRGEPILSDIHDDNDATEVEKLET